MEDAAQEASSGMEEGVDGLMAEEETSVVVAVTLEEVILVEVSSVEVVEMALVVARSYGGLVVVWWTHICSARL